MPLWSAISFRGAGFIRSPGLSGCPSRRFFAGTSGDCVPGHRVHRPCRRSATPVRRNRRRQRSSVRVLRRGDRQDAHRGGLNLRSECGVAAVRKDCRRRMLILRTRASPRGISGNPFVLAEGRRNHRACLRERQGLGISPKRSQGLRRRAMGVHRQRPAPYQRVQHRGIRCG